MSIETLPVPAPGTELIIAIDAEDSIWDHETPYTLNVRTVTSGTERTYYVNGEGALIGNDVPTMLRALATSIENERVFS